MFSNFSFSLHPNITLPPLQVQPCPQGTRGMLPKICLHGACLYASILNFCQNTFHVFRFGSIEGLL